MTTHFPLPEPRVRVVVSYIDTEDRVIYLDVTMPGLVMRGVMLPTDYLQGVRIGDLVLDAPLQTPLHASETP